MKWRFLQVRYPTARASAVVAALALVGLAPALRAQGGAPTPGPDPLCQCFVGDDSTGARGRGWALLGAAGLALLAGIPIGGAGTAAIPFVEGPPAPPAGSLAEVAAAPAALPAAGLPPGVAAIPARPGAAALDVAPMAGLPVPPLAFVPPKTATHLPLLAAAGVLLMGGGGLLARRQARRQRRRRRRAVAI